MRRPQPLPVASPRGGKRGCLCKDNTYKSECCDGSIQAQGIGSMVQQSVSVRPSEVWFNFNGTTNYAIYPSNSFAFAGSQYTFGFYVRPFDLYRQRQIILQADNFSIEIQGLNLVLAQGSNSINIGTLVVSNFVYVAITINGSSILTYLIPDDTQPPVIITGTLNGINLNAISNLTIGASTNGSYPFFGNFAYFGMWQRLLTQSEVLSIENKNFSQYTAGERVDFIHAYEFSYYLKFNILNLANDLIGVPPINGTINDL